MAARRHHQVRPVHVLRSRLALARARALCRERGERLTPLRLEVLRLLACSDVPLGAYALLAKLRQGRKDRVDAPTVYRVIEFLSNLRLVTRIESRSAYVLADHAAQPEASVFFLCDTCNASVAVENGSVADLIAGSARTLGFLVNKPVIECNGTCARCLASPAVPVAGAGQLP